MVLKCTRSLRECAWASMYWKLIFEIRSEANFWNFNPSFWEATAVSHSFCMLRSDLSACPSPKFTVPPSSLLTTTANGGTCKNCGFANKYKYNAQLLHYLLHSPQFCRIASQAITNREISKPSAIRFRCYALTSNLAWSNTKMRRNVSAHNWRALDNNKREDKWDKHSDRIAHSRTHIDSAHYYR